MSEKYYALEMCSNALYGRVEYVSTSIATMVPWLINLQDGIVQGTAPLPPAVHPEPKLPRGITFGGIELDIT